MLSALTVRWRFDTIPCLSLSQLHTSHWCDLDSECWDQTAPVLHLCASVSWPRHMLPQLGGVLHMDDIETSCMICCPGI